MRNAFVVPLGVLVTASAPLFMGFTTYLVGLGFALMAMGEVERWIASSRSRHLRIAALLLLAWVSNPVCWALAAGWIACAAVVRRERRRVLLTLLPGAALATHFFLAFGEGGREAPLLFLSIGRFAIPSSPFYAMHVAAWMLGTAIALGVLIHALWLLVSDGHWNEEWRARLLAVGGVLLGVVLAPDRALGAGGSIVMRLQLALFIVAAAVVAWGRPARVSARTAFLHPLLAGGYVVALVAGMVMLQPPIREHASLPVRAGLVTLRWHERLGIPLALPEDEAAETLTVRQLTEKHASDPRCAGCHARIDPYGFALESFDAIGRRRERDLGGRPIDSRAKAPDGARFEDIDGLRGYLLTNRRDAFVKQSCRKLLGYSLGRGVQLSDRPLLREMHERLEASDYRISAAIETIVRSRQFREIRGKEMASEE